MMSHLRFLIAFLLLTKISVFAAPDEVLGKVGDSEVRLDDLKKTLDGLGERDRDAMRRDPTSLNQFVRSALVQQLVLKEAKAKNWEQSPEVADRLARLKDNVVATSYLESMNQPPKSYPDETELKAAYEASKDALLVPKSWRLAQVFVSEAKGNTDQKAAEAAAAKLERLKKSLGDKRSSFESIANDESEERTSAARGGEIGWLTENQIQPAIRDILPKLKLGEVSEPVRLDDGWHIIKVLDIREPYTPTLDQIRSQLAQQLRAERTRSNTQAFLARLLQENPIALNEMALSKLLPAESPAPNANGGK